MAARLKMEYKRFSKTGEKVFDIGLGTYGYGDAYGGISKEDSFEVLNSIVKSTPTYANLLIDTAPLYGAGTCEKWIGEFLAVSGTANVLIAAKGGRHIEPDRVNEKDFSPEFLKAGLGESLKRLGANEIFLYQLHNPSLGVLTEGSVFDLLEEFRDEGKIRFYGVSIDSPTEGIAAIEVCRRKGYDGLAAIQVVYNILNKTANKKLFEIAKDSNIAIIAREPLFRGFLTDKYSSDDNLSSIPSARQKEIDLYGLEQINLKVGKIRKLLQKYEVNVPLSKVAIKFVVSHPYVTLTIPGTNRQEYVEPNLNAANTALDDALLSELNDIADITSPYGPAVFTDLPANVENNCRYRMGVIS